MSKYHHCRVKHKPPHTYGDCLRAAVASLLDVEETLSVPHFFEDGCDGRTGMERLREWLKTQGLAPFYVFFSEDRLEDVLFFMETVNPGVRYILTGSTENEDHSVIYAGDDLIHDPAWCAARLVGPASNGYWTALTVVPLSVTE